MISISPTRPLSASAAVRRNEQEQLRQHEGVAGGGARVRSGRRCYHAHW